MTFKLLSMFFRVRAKDMSIVHVYFNVDSVFPRLRKEMITTVDLIANAGGLLGLCMGFSALSLLEIIYHGTLRLLCKIHQKRFQMKVTQVESSVTNTDDNNQFVVKTAFTKESDNVCTCGRSLPLPVYLQTSYDADLIDAVKRLIFIHQN